MAIRVGGRLAVILFGTAVLAIACGGMAAARARAGNDLLAAGGRGHWSDVYCAGLTARGAYVGMPGEYDPQLPMSRAEFVYVLVKSLLPGEFGDAGGGAWLTAFPDVAPGRWGAAAAAVAFEHGWVKGYGDGTFRSDSAVSRAEAVVILVRALAPGLEGDGAYGEPHSPGADARGAPDWARDAVEKALRLKWLTGDPDGALRLSDAVRFGEGCALVWRALDVHGGKYDVAGTVSAAGDAAGDGERAIRVKRGSDVDTLRVVEGAVVFRNGAACRVRDLAPLDEVYAILDEDGLAAFVEARFVDDVGFVDDVDVELGALRYVDRQGILRETRVMSDADIFVQRNKSSLESVSRGDRLYAVFDSRSGAARILDVLKMNAGGRIVSVSGDGSRINARVVGVGTETLRVAPDAIVYLNDVVAGVGDLREGDVFQGSVSADGTVLFLQVLGSNVR